MADGMVKPINKRMAQIDAAEQDALSPAKPTPVKVAPTSDDGPPITAAQAEANQKARVARDAAEEKARGMPKPGLLDRAKKLFGG